MKQVDLGKAICMSTDDSYGVLRFETMLRCVLLYSKVQDVVISIRCSSRILSNMGCWYLMLSNLEMIHCHFRLLVYLYDRWKDAKA